MKICLRSSSGLGRLGGATVRALGSRLPLLEKRYSRMTAYPVVSHREDIPEPADCQEFDVCLTLPDE